MEKIIVYTDGGSRGNPGLSGVGIVISDHNKKVIKKISKAIGLGTNNYAEYEAIIIAFGELKKLYGKKALNMEFEFRMDSELVQRQLSGVYQIKEEGLYNQFIKIWNFRVKDFPHVKFIHVRREENNMADGLANEAMDRA